MNPLLAAFGGLVVGLVVGSYLTYRHKSDELDKALSEADFRWRVSMSNLIGHLLSLGYETRIEDGVFEVDASPDNYLISMHIRRFDPATLLESLKDLTPACNWLGLRGGEEPDAPGSDPPSTPPTDETPVPTETAAPPEPPA